MLNLLQADNTDFVIADRRGNGGTENAGVFRHIISFFSYTVTNLVLGIKYKDTQAGFKGFTSRCAKSLANIQTVKRFAFDMEYLYLAYLYGFNVVTMPVVYENDILSTTVHVFRDSIRTLLDVIRIRKNKRKYLSQENQP